MLDSLSVAGSSLLKDLAKGLIEGRHSLYFDGEGGSLHDHLIVEQILILFYNEEVLTTQEMISFTGLFHG